MRITYCDRCSRRISIDDSVLSSEEPACCETCARTAQHKPIRNSSKPQVRLDHNAPFKRAGVGKPSEPAKVSGLQRAVQAVVSLVW